MAIVPTTRLHPRMVKNASNRSAPVLNGREVSNGVDSLRKAGHYGELIVDKAANESSRSGHRLCRGRSSSDYRDAPAFDEIPPALKVKQFDRVVRHAQLHRVLAGTVDPDSKMLDTSPG
jgi:hypothetical protein